MQKQELNRILLRNIAQLMGPNDLFLFYFNGHGSRPGTYTGTLPKKIAKYIDKFIDIAGDPLDVIPFDEEVDGTDEWLVTYGEKREDWIRDDELEKLFEEIKMPNIVMIIQSCYADGVAKDIRRLPNVSTISAAPEDKEVYANIFSSAVIKCIKNFEDFDKDGKLTVEDVARFTKSFSNWDAGNHIIAIK